MSNRILNAQFPPEEASESVEEELIQERGDSIGKPFETHSIRTVDSVEDEQDDVDMDGLPINQMQDGMQDGHKIKSRRFHVPRRK
jgi:hypothetical protein